MRIDDWGSKMSTAMRVVAGGVAALCAGVFCLPLALGAGGNTNGQEWQDACRPTTSAVQVANNTQTKPTPEPAPSTDTQVLVPLDPQGPQTRATWNAPQVRNAATITSVARTRGLSPRAAVIAVATAMQESSLTNLHGGDRDSVGLFQQRPSQGWGTVVQLTDPIYASSKFYDTLVKVSGWQTKPLSQAAQSVQRSGLPGAYAKWEQEAGALVAKAWGSRAFTSISAGCESDGSNDPVGHFTVKNPRVPAQAIVAARGASGSSGWYRRCDNFVSQAYGWGSSGSTSANVHWNRLVHMGLAHPGDNNPPPGALLFYDTGESAGHVALYLGGDMVASNDILGAGTIGIVHRKDITDGTWRLRYRGWSEPAFPDAGGATTI